MPQNLPNQNRNKHAGIQNIIHYSGIAFQMFGIILLFAWAGKKIDIKYFNGENIFVIILSLIGVISALYIVLKDFLNINKRK